MRVKDVLSKLTPYQQGKQIKDIQKQFNIERIVKLSSNENPFGYSDAVKSYMSERAFDLNIHPDGHASELRKALADKLAVQEDQLVFGSGSDELVQIICRTFLYPGARVVMASPTFPQYKHQALIEGAEIDEVPTIDGYHHLEGMLDQITDDTNLVFICAPDNPTGTLVTKESFEHFMEQCPKDVIVVLDEAYYEYVEEDVRLQSIDYLKTYDNLIVLRTFSKAYGLAGLRVGYGIMNERLAVPLNTVRGPFNVSAVAQKLAEISLKDDQFIEDSVTKNRKNLNNMTAFLDEIGWSYYPSQTNFLLISTPIAGTDVFNRLIKEGFIVRPGELLGYPQTIRMTIGKEEDMQALQNTLKTLHHELDGV